MFGFTNIYIHPLCYSDYGFPGEWDDLRVCFVSSGISAADGHISSEVKELFRQPQPLANSEVGEFNVFFDLRPPPLQHNRDTTGDGQKGGEEDRRETAGARVHHSLFYTQEAGHGRGVNLLIQTENESCHCINIQICTTEQF